MAHRYLKFQCILPIYNPHHFHNSHFLYKKRYFSSSKLYFEMKKNLCNSGKPKIVPLEEVRSFITQCLKCLGVDTGKAGIFATSLTVADHKGIYSHGLNRLEHYIKDIKEKNCNPNANPQIVADSRSAATVEGNNGLGAVIGMFCMELAIKKAAETGIGMVVAKTGSNHFGLNSFYTEFAVDNGYIGMAFTNTSPVMVPTGAKKVCLGTNPISIAAPGDKGDRIIIDFATTAVALGKIEIYKRKKEKIPLGWALDENGKPTTDPEVAMKAKRLMPLGGNESHKGTGLALMVEILSGLISGAAYGPTVRTWGEKPARPANLGHGFIAIDPCKFGDGFQARLTDLMCTIRALEPANPKFPPIIPGDIEKRHKEQINKQGGVIYTPNHWEMIDRIVKDLGVKPPKVKRG